MHKVYLSQSADIALVAAHILGYWPSDTLVALSAARTQPLHHALPHEERMNAGPMMSFTVPTPSETPQLPVLPAQVLTPQLHTFTATYHVQSLALVWFCDSLERVLASPAQLAQLMASIQELAAYQRPGRNGVSVYLMVADRAQWLDVAVLLSAIAPENRQMRQTWQTRPSSQQGYESWLLLARASGAVHPISELLDSPAGRALHGNTLLGHKPLRGSSDANAGAAGATGTGDVAKNDGVAKSCDVAESCGAATAGDVTESGGAATAGDVTKGGDVTHSTGITDLESSPVGDVPVEVDRKFADDANREADRVSRFVVTDRDSRAVMDCGSQDTEIQRSEIQRSAIPAVSQAVAQAGALPEKWRNAAWHSYTKTAEKIAAGEYSPSMVLWNNSLRALIQGSDGQLNTANMNYGKVVGSPRRAGELLAQLVRQNVRDRVILFAVLPQIGSVASVSNRKLVKMMGEASESVPDPDKIHAVIGVIAFVNALVRGGDVYACAVVGYLHWWLGEGRAALASVQQALARNPECSLAKLVRYALSVQLPPPWVET
ncbi:MAG: hypothetical protein PUK59_06090 [Actinomycetaceae bacterium]|nr:hypothetical protein [Actinomycetaceae bacterium]